jgi:HPt (histidine-containing phosphotransfer) domain-containing protein
MTFDDGASGRVRGRSVAAAALLPRFLEHRRRDLATLVAALEHGDFETLARLGHNMSGNGVSYGFPEISAIGERLEAEAIAGNPSAVREHLAALEACLARASEEVASEAARRAESSTQVRAVTGDAKGISRQTRQR